MRIEKNFYKILACPKCKELLKQELDFFYCNSCLIKFPLIDRKIFFIKSIIENNKKNNLQDKIKKFLLFIKLSSTFKSRSNKLRIPKLISKLKDNQYSLNIGSGNKDYSPNIINVDIENTNKVDIIADSRDLPIISDSISLVISEAVLEHVSDTVKNINEINRVLKTDGLLYIEVPFMQTYHAHPNDYFRFTHRGLESYLKNFRILEKGISVGPASAFALNLRIFLSILFSFNSKKLFVLLTVFFSWITYPIKFIDFFLEKNSLSHFSASGIYIIAQKKN